MLAAQLIPVTFTVNNATPASPGDYIFLTGNTIELGNWGTTFGTAVGPMLSPNYPNWSPEYVAARQHDGAIQVHQNCRERDRDMGERG